MGDPVRILMVTTSHAVAGEGGRSTGVWLEELTTPYYIFRDAGCEVDIASVAGGRVPIDPHSLNAAEGNPLSVERFLHDKAALSQLEGSLGLEALQVARYAAIFLPGGHGTMWDLPSSQSLAALLNAAWQQGRVVAAVCHGPAGLVSARDENDRPLVSGRRVSAFTNSEEAAAGLTGVVPFLLETRLRELGARYESGPDFQSFAVRDGRLVTGQNPASSEPVARLVLEALGIRG